MEELTATRLKRLLNDPLVIRTDPSIHRVQDKNADDTIYQLDIIYRLCGFLFPVALRTVRNSTRTFTAENPRYE